MQTQADSLLILLAGICATTIIAIIGSITSRKLRFNYSYLAILSIILYIAVTRLIYGKTEDKILTLSFIMFLGFYDGTVGWRLSKKFNAFHGRFTEFAEKTTGSQAIIASLFFSSACGLAGILIPL